MTYLPNDIWHMVCTQLWHQRDFNTLFNCACSGKQLAPIAVRSLYRISGIAYSEGYSDGEIFVGPMWCEQRFTKCTGLWRTIILSSLGKTLYPYAQYIRTLDLRDLEALLRQFEFNPRRISRALFYGELQFKVFEYSKAICESDARSHLKIIRPRVDVMKTIVMIGEATMKQNPLLKELTGEVPIGKLSQWIPKLPRLRHWNTWGGAALTSGNGALIRLHCPSFTRLGSWDRANSDENVAAFLNELRPQSLESFETSYPCKEVGPETLYALSRHGESLVQLKLDNLLWQSIPEISILKGCTHLVSLSLAGNELYMPDLEKNYIENFLEMAAWLKRCKNLQILAFAKFYSALALATPILLDNSIRLTSLKYQGCAMRDTHNFHQALANQTSLKSLWLEGATRKEAMNEEFIDVENPEERMDEEESMDKEDADILIESLSKLVNLTNLHLVWPRTFGDPHIMRLASCLPKLEVWSTSGYWLTDAIWDKVKSLKSLRTLDLYGIASFTADGILGFIENAGPGNKGLVLSVKNLDEISKEEHDLIKRTITRKLKGEFNFAVVIESGHQVVNYSYDDSDSSDSEVE